MIDWKKEVEQTRGMFHGVHKDILITLLLMAIVTPPIFVFLWVFDFLVKMW